MDLEIIEAGMQNVILSKWETRPKKFIIKSESSKWWKFRQKETNW